MLILSAHYVTFAFCVTMSCNTVLASRQTSGASAEGDAPVTLLMGYQLLSRQQIHAAQFDATTARWVGCVCV
jgi:hypothetical protein